MKKNLYVEKSFKNYRLIFFELHYRRLGKLQESEKWQIDEYRNTEESMRVFFLTNWKQKKSLFYFEN